LSWAHLSNHPAQLLKSIKMLNDTSGTDAGYLHRVAPAPDVQSARLDTVKNKLLRLIPLSERARLLSAAELVRIQPRQILHHWKLPIEHVYFIEQGLVTVTAKIDRDRFIEVWLVGSDGLVGSSVVLAEDIEPMHRRIVQVGGRAWRIGVREFRIAFDELPQLRATVYRYLGAVLMQTSQSGACNSAHQVKHRLARWLLIAQRALDSMEIPLTHEVLSQLLGVRRASVTETLNQLEAEGNISMKRGSIFLSSLADLERTCCHCFRQIDREYHRRLFCQAAATALNGKTFN
jgi:CRP-like cAMP-binding protein